MCDGTEEWNQFSCIQSTMTDEFDFIVYSCSHKLKENEQVNPKTSIQFKFPKDGSYFIIWHGRLVHGGAASLLDKDQNAIKSSRMFSYLRVPEHNHQFSGTRRSTRLKNYKVILKEDTVDTHSFSIMKSRDENDKDSRLVITLPNNDSTIKNQKMKVEPILGNMNDDGWEIYEGINFHDREMKQYKKHLNTLLVKKKNNWNGISSTDRKIYVLSTLECHNDGVMANLRCLYRAFEYLLMKKLRKIPYLEEVDAYYRAILANFGHVEDQNPHRDFWSIKK